MLRLWIPVGVLGAWATLAVIGPWLPGDPYPGWDAGWATMT
jgi:hypothetical protein